MGGVGRIAHFTDIDADQSARERGLAIIGVRLFAQQHCGQRRHALVARLVERETVGEHAQHHGFAQAGLSVELAEIWLAEVEWEIALQPPRLPARDQSEHQDDVSCKLFVHAAPVFADFIGKKKPRHLCRGFLL
jgi:hypothetical protein